MKILLDSALYRDYSKAKRKTYVYRGSGVNEYSTEPAGVEVKER